MYYFGYKMGILYNIVILYYGWGISVDNLERKLQKVLKECEFLKEENRKLKEILKLNNIPINRVQSQTGFVKSKEHIVKDRITIFKGLFKGRTDTHAVRFEYPDGKSGYSPAKDKLKKLIPLTDQVMYDHLSGKKTIGLYPMLKDETCWFFGG